MYSVENADKIKDHATIKSIHVIDEMKCDSSLFYDSVQVLKLFHGLNDQFFLDVL